MAGRDPGQAGAGEWAVAPAGEARPLLAARPLLSGSPLVGAEEGSQCRMGHCDPTRPL